MKNIEVKNLVFIALATAFLALIVLSLFAPLQRTEGVRIGINMGSSQGEADNNSGMEKIKVNGTFWNEGDIIAKNLTATLILIDTANNKTVRKTVGEGIDLPPDKGQAVEFYSEYIRERTIPKTDINIKIRFEWIENGQLNTPSP